MDTTALTSRTVATGTRCELRLHLRRLRGERPLAPLAASVGLTSEQFTALEDGREMFVSWPLLVRLCEVLRCDITDLVSLRETVIDEVTLEEDFAAVSAWWCEEIATCVRERVPGGLGIRVTGAYETPGSVSIAIRALFAPDARPALEHAMEDVEALLGVQLELAPTPARAGAPLPAGLRAVS